MPGELALELQDVHDEVLGSPVDRGMQLVQAQLVLQHVFLLIIDLRAEESDMNSENLSLRGKTQGVWMEREENSEEKN